MFTTLESLNRAVVASPEDHTVRLAYADALDETDDKAAAARAEFIRAQIESKSTGQATQPDPENDRCRDLFETHWLDWWRPVAEAAGLPAPHVPSRRLRDRVARSVRSVVQEEPRPANWPYTHTTSPGNLAVHLAEYGTSIRFDAGFPEEVRFNNLDTPENMPELPHRWGEAMPLVRLAFSHAVTPAQWLRVDGSHLARLPELIFDRLLPDTTMLVVASPNLMALTRLRVNPLATGADGGNTNTVQFLVQSPVWAGLRSLHFTGRLTPNAVHTLANQCNMEHLEELELMIGNPNALERVVSQAINAVIRHFIHTLAFEGNTAIRWADYGPALESLAAAPWVRKLRRLRISSDNPNGLLGVLGDRLYGTAERGADLIPDASVYALVEAMNSPTLERLVLPGSIIGPSVREELMSRLGSRVAFA
ncbi:MAG: hypothetical protein C0467_23725 [Planctomycetaceae bacterium]|nr:hypothetical protein [Planctomycetaceae bacterium]